ncbi:stress response protein nst1 [Seiridium cupressi]
MYYNATNSFDWQSSPLSGTTSSWDPDTVLGLIHPMRGSFRCTGYAPSKNRRCMNNVGSFQSGRSILLRLSKGDVSRAIDSPGMHRAAGFTLCYLHGDQVDNVASKWSSLLRTWASENSKPTKARSESPLPYTFDAKTRKSAYVRVKKEEDLEYDVESLLETNFGPLPRKNMTLREMLRFLAQEVEEREEAERQARGKEEREAREKKEQEAREKKEQEAREKEEREAREKEEHEQREREARKREEQQRKEREAREERVRLAKERREKEAREKAAREAQSWTQSWENYIKSRDAIKTFRSQRCAAKQPIPWPVKSGLAADVDAANVKLFFRKAPPGDLINTGESRFMLMNSENKRWHTDKLMQNFGTEMASGEFKETFDTIARVVIQLRQEAQRDRRG